MPGETGYARLLKNAGFDAFLGTTFLGAIVFVCVLKSVVAGPLFVIPFLLFAGYSGYLADRFSKARVIRIAAVALIAVALIGVAAPISGRIELLLLAALASLFSPAIVGILPEMLTEAQIARADGLLQLTTVAAVLIGGFLYPLMPLVLPGIAIAGALASLGIGKVPAARSNEAFHWNPLHEIIAGVRELRTRKSLLLSLCGLSWFWFFAPLFLLTQPLLTQRWPGAYLAALAAAFGLGGIAAGALSGDYIELALVPAGLALMGIFSGMMGTCAISPHAIPGLVAIGCGGGLFAVPLSAYLQREAPPARKGRILATNNFANMLAVALAWLLHDRIHGSVIILILGIAMLLASVVLIIKMPETVVRFILWCVAMALFRIRLEGRENIPRTGGALLVSNHISYADAVLVGCTTRLRTIHFLMWQPIFDAPVANYFFRILEAIPIDAASTRSTVRALRLARAELQRGELVGIFPEGLISRTGEIGHFERGFEKILQGTGAPVIPIRIDGLYGHPFSCKAGAPFRTWEKLWRPAVTVRIGAPIHGSLTATGLRQSVVDLAPA
jgi:acyl-[acyl-carrier-protein]-phospholipid O-acyltransferase/long-chain-fatty-acid--[acyl-carrier-protein] ligase